MEPHKSGLSTHHIFAAFTVLSWMVLSSSSVSAWPTLKDSENSNNSPFWFHFYNGNLKSESAAFRSFENGQITDNAFVNGQQIVNALFKMKVDSDGTHHEGGNASGSGQTPVKRAATFGRRLASVDSKFLSVTMDMEIVRWKFKGLDFGSKKLHNLAANLAPANVRCGGTDADFLIFDANGDESRLPTPSPEEWGRRYRKMPGDRSFERSNITMTGNQWLAWVNFTQNAGLDMMYNLNALQFGDDGLWNSTNAAEFLDYSAARNIPIPTFQLGNEPDLYPSSVSIPGATMAKNFVLLRYLLTNYPLYQGSRIVGPDTGGVGTYLKDFVKAGAYKTVSALGFHQYYLNGHTATLEDFTNYKLLDKLKTTLDTARSIIHEYPPLVDLELSETSSAFSNGTDGLSDRYVAGFLWLDKLGVSSQYGLKAVNRQSFYGGHYALLDEDMNPRPDYFLSVLYKRLVKGTVFDISVSPSTPCLRVYANCASTDYYLDYAPGAVVVYYVNMCTTNETLTLSQFKDNELDLFQLTPGDADGLLSKYVSLNGQKLELSEDDLPFMFGVQHKGDVQLPPQSFGFIVVPLAYEPLCKA